MKTHCAMKDCKKKIRLGQETSCKCGLLFCLTHRYADQHRCTFDYRQEQQNKIKKENPEVIADKIRKI